MRILLAGSVRVLIALALCASSAATFASERSVERTVAADPNSPVEISTVSGSVDIEGWDQPQVEVKGTISGNVERVDVTNDRGRTSINVVFPSRSHGEAILKIRVPKGCELDVAAVSAEIRSKNVFGGQRLKTVSGDIFADLHAGDVETKTVSGNTELHGDGKPISVRATTISGDINYEHGAGDLEAATVSGRLKATLESGKDIRLRTTSGDAMLTGSLARGASVEAEAISGGVTVRMRSEGGFRYEASSFSGDIDNCFGSEAERTHRHGPGTRLIGTRGDGKGEVRLKTMSGDVEICDR